MHGAFRAQRFGACKLKVKVNGKVEDVAAGTTILQYVESAGYRVDRIAVEVNRNIAPKSTYANVGLHDGDSVEIVSFCGGG